MKEGIHDEVSVAGPESSELAPLAKLPDRLADLFEREERYDVLPNDLQRVMEHISARVAIKGAA